MKDCLIRQEGNNKIAQITREWMTQYHIAALEEDSRKGLVRHIMGRTGGKNRGSDGGAHHQRICGAPPEGTGPAAEGPDSRFHHSGPEHQYPAYQRNHGPEKQGHLGPRLIHDQLGKFTFAISPHSFFQVNTEQAELLHETALQYAALTGKENVIDAYCGTGTITLFLAQKARRAWALKLCPPPSTTPTKTPNTTT